MDTPAPLAARFFYTLALLVAAAAFLVLLVALFGSAWMITEEIPLLSILPGAFGVMVAVEGALVAGFLAAIGAVVHDIRRIVVNTSEDVLARQIAALARTRRPDSPRPTSTSGVSYFYEQNGVEHGPVNQARMAELLRSKRVTPFERIERCENGIREPFDPTEFGFS